MGWKLDFDDCSNVYSMKVRQEIKEIMEFILSDRTMTMRKASRELGIPRRTLHRYALEYTVMLDQSYPEFDEYGERIDYQDAKDQVEHLIKRNVRKYQHKRW